MRQTLIYLNIWDSKSLTSLQLQCQWYDLYVCLEGSLRNNDFWPGCCATDNIRSASCPTKALQICCWAAQTVDLFYHTKSTDCHMIDWFIDYILIRPFRTSGETPSIKNHIELTCNVLVCMYVCMYLYICAIKLPLNQEIVTDLTGPCVKPPWPRNHI